jgi:hypothetical protein
MKVYVVVRILIYLGNINKSLMYEVYLFTPVCSTHIVYIYIFYMFKG